MSAFSELDLDTFLSILEDALQTRLTGLAYNLPSYVNRVLEIETESGERLVAKFYRPGRWEQIALQEEHQFMKDCVESELPVVAPIQLNTGKTLGIWNHIFFAVYPRKAGRLQELCADEDWKRMGRLIGRLHSVARKRTCTHRRILDPIQSDELDLERIANASGIPAKERDNFFSISEEIIDTIEPLFENKEFIRIHGDLHAGNILHRAEKGDLLIDFDDMMLGSPVQDLWLLLPDYLPKANREWNLLLEGYNLFSTSNENWTTLVEPLRAIRMFHFLAWASLQVNESHFASVFPDWDTSDFWLREIRDLEDQLTRIQNSML